MFGPLFGEDSHFDLYFSDGLVQPSSSSTLEGFFHVAAWDQEIAEIQQRIQKTHHATNEKVGIFWWSGLQPPNGIPERMGLRKCISGFKFGVIYIICSVSMLDFR